MLSFLSCVFISEVKWLFKCLLAMCELLLLNFWLLFHIFKSSLYLAGRSTESWLRYQTTYRFWKKKTCNQEKKSMRIKRKEWVRKDNQNRTCTSQGTPITCAGPGSLRLLFLQLPPSVAHWSDERLSWKKKQNYKDLGPCSSSLADSHKVFKSNLPCSPLFPAPCHSPLRQGLCPWLQDTNFPVGSSPPWQPVQHQKDSTRTVCWPAFNIQGPTAPTGSADPNSGQVSCT